MKHNDIDIAQWRESDINTDSLWLIKERDKRGKHKNIYHGNFIPQIPHQLIRRYTKQGEIVLEPFMGSGTTLFESEILQRKYIGFDINEKMIDYVSENTNNNNQHSIHLCNVLDKEQVSTHMQTSLAKMGKEKTQFLLMHPPYMDIVKFTTHRDDLSHILTLKEFVAKFKIVCENLLQFLDKNRYFALVIGDIYRNSEVVPLGFYCMDMIKRNFKVKLKGTIIKNIEGNRGKLGVGGIWRYRALNSDYYIFKHEYIFVFKKEF